MTTSRVLAVFLLLVQCAVLASSLSSSASPSALRLEKLERQVAALGGLQQYVSPAFGKNNKAGAFAAGDDRGVCIGNRPHVAQYNVTALSDTAYVRLDTQSGFAAVVCDIDRTSLTVHFATSAAAANFATQVAEGIVITGQQGIAECEKNYGMFRRVSAQSSGNYTVSVHTGALTAAVSVSPFFHDLAASAAAMTATTYGVTLRVFKARADNVLKSGTVKFGPAPSGSLAAFACEPAKQRALLLASASASAASTSALVSDPANFCLGINTNKDCSATAGPLDLYSNSKLSVTCTNCYMAFAITVDLELKMDDFLLYDSHFKLADMEVSGSLVATMNAQEQWGINADAVIPIVGPTNIIQFWLGPLPINIGFELPLKRTADASFDATANAVVGAQMQWKLGTYEVLWNPLDGWHNAANEPGLVYKTEIQGEAEFNGAANFGLAPSITVHLDSFFKTTVNFDAEVHATVQGSTAQKQICANVNYATSAGCTAELDIAIPWINLDKSWNWAATWFNQQGSIPQQCISAKNISLPKLTHVESEVPVRIASPKALKPQQAAARGYKQPVLSSGDTTLTRLKGVDHACIKQKGYSLHYDAAVPAAYSLINLDSFSGIKKVVCNAGGAHFRVEFHHDSERKSFESQARAPNAFLTGDLTMSQHCGDQLDTKVFLMRVQSVKDTSIPLLLSQVEVAVSASRYDEIFQHADISLMPNSALQCGGGSASAVRNAAVQESDHVCLGVNANADCSAAKAPIQLYQSPHITLNCENCFAAFQADLFFDLKIRDFQLESLEGGFQNISVDAALILELLASEQWSSGTNIDQDVVPPTTLLSFAVGPIPIRLWFEIPLKRSAQASASAKATLSAGVTGKLNIGDYYVQWSSGTWTVVKPKPVLSWAPSFDATASAEATMDLLLAPTFAFHVDSVFWTTLELSSSLHGAINTTLVSKSACLEADTQLTAIANAELDINIGYSLLSFEGHWKYGPQTVYDSGRKQLANKCISI